MRKRMKIIWYHPSMDAQCWLAGLARRLPDAEIRLWQPGDDACADYAIVRSPPVEMLAGRSLKGLFAMGAGVEQKIVTALFEPTFHCLFSLGRALQRQADALGEDDERDLLRCEK